MKWLANGMLVLLAVLHIWFLVLEMFLWNHPVGRRIFRMTEEVARSSQVLAANQGLYNGFLAAGLMWGVISGAIAVQVFFLVCVLVAGLFGGITASRSILLVQALPAGLGLALVYLAR